ncbi:MAG: metallophosphoesterase family protein [Flavobacteriales bacterium]
MKHIVLLSDTHSTIDKAWEKHLKKADEIWHAGDIGSYAVAEYLQTFAPLRAVYGNIDDAEMRNTFPEHQVFELEQFRVWMTHIGGYPPNYNSSITKKWKDIQPQIFICGHSHILKVMYDKSRECLHLNPGACGKHGFHKVRTFLSFNLHKGKISAMQIIENKR